MNSQPLNKTVVSLIWVTTMIVSAFFVPSIVEYVLRNVTYSFLLLAPFAWTWFPSLVLIGSVSIWVAKVLDWSAATVNLATRILFIFVSSALLLHGAWVLFVVARGGL